MTPTPNLFRHAERTVNFRAGETIFLAGDEATEMYGVQAGEVSIVHRDTEIEVVGEGGFFGEMALIDKGTRSAAAVAKTDCTLVPVDERQFLFLVQQTPYFALYMLRIQAQRLRQRMG
jgi:CRP/FNR family transcriptional regulator, cyclic AMP receptor protein